MVVGQDAFGMLKKEMKMMEANGKKNSTKFIRTELNLFVFLIILFAFNTNAFSQTQYQFTGLSNPFATLPLVTVDYRDHYLGFGDASGEGYGRHPGIDYGASL